MEVELWAHPAAGAIGIDELWVTLERPSATLVRLLYVVHGAIDDLVLPALAPPVRTNGLWKATCFEAFLMPAQGSGYSEFNFSPAGNWAAYDFDGYREGMRDGWLPAYPDIAVRRAENRLEIAVAFSPEVPVEPCRLGLSAVLEEKGGHKSYWAINHSGETPDFHHPDCFALTLPPPDEA